LVPFRLRRLVVMFMQFVYTFLFSVFRLTHQASSLDSENTAFVWRKAMFLMKT
jgi:hypothetical protein